MLDRLKRLLAGPPAPDSTTSSAPDTPDKGLRLAACALLLELAYADNEFSEGERRHIEDALGRHFELSPEESRELMAAADEARREAVDLHQFTSLVTDRYDEGQRLLLAEVMWRVVHADGVLTAHEDLLMQRLARLLDLRPGYLSAARQRATQDPA